MSFQLTAPRRSRRKLQEISTNQLRFNSWLRKGADGTPIVPSLFLRSRFNSRPHKGADDMYMVVYYTATVFQLSTPRRIRLNEAQAILSSNQFQLTVPQWNRPSMMFQKHTIHYFNSQHHKGIGENDGYHTVSDEIISTLAPTKELIRLTNY